MNEKRPEIEELKRHDKLYAAGNTELSDPEYDWLKEQAFEKYPNDQYFKTVGLEPEISNKVELDFVLGSLTKKKPDGSMTSWMDDMRVEQFCVSLKADGVSFEVLYENGEPVLANTRGDGVYGQNILNKAKIFCPKPKTNEKIRLRGELILHDYERFGFKNSRNGCAGLINRIETSSKFNINDYKHITPVFYEVIEYKGVGSMSQSDQLRYIEYLSLPVVPFIGVDKTFSEEQFMNLYREMENEVNYDTDGLVVVCENAKRENVKYPKRKICFKINDVAVKTSVVNIRWNTTRTGQVVPIVNIDPVIIGGVKVSNATGFNAKYIKDNNINSGSCIGIVRSGEVIPYITEIFSKSEKASLPETCSSCGEKVEWSITEVNLICNNSLCPSQRVKQISHFFTSLGCENFSEQTVINLGVKNIIELIGMSEQEIAQLDGFGKRSAQIIKSEINRCLNCSESNFLQALGLNGIGEKLSVELCDRYHIEDLLYGKIQYIDLIKISGIGTILAENILKIKQFQGLYEDLTKQGLRFKEKEQIEKSDLTGKMVAFTGSGPMKRKEFETALKLKGAKTGGVTKNTDILVLDDLESTSSKAVKARKLGIEMMVYEDFINKYL